MSVRRRARTIYFNCPTKSVYQTRYAYNVPLFEKLPFRIKNKFSSSRNGTFNKIRERRHSSNKLTLLRLTWLTQTAIQQLRSLRLSQKKQTAKQTKRKMSHHHRLKKIVFPTVATEFHNVHKCQFHSVQLNLTHNNFNKKISIKTRLKKKQKIHKNNWISNNRLCCFFFNFCF